jgi:hypothetical protein
VAGTYSVIVTDANGCTANKSVIITQPAAVATTATQENATCYGTSTGSINLTVTGGITPYTYVWTATAGGIVPTGQANNQNLTGLVAGTYSVIVTDANGCTANKSVIITQPAAVATTATQVNVTCYGTSTGSINLSITGGTTPYTYVWTATAGGIVPTGQANNQNLTGLLAGTYSVAVTDANGCTTNKSVIITQPAAVATTATQVNVTCYGDATGSITLTVTGGTASYTYVWSATAGGTVPTGQANNQHLTGLLAGTYSVAVTDANGCTANKTVIITQPAALTTTNTQVNATCYGTATGSINLTVTGGKSYGYRRNYPLHLCVDSNCRRNLYQQDKQTTRTLPVCWLEPTVWR